MANLELYVARPSPVSDSTSWSLYHVDPRWDELEAEEMHAVVMEYFPDLRRWLLLDEQGDPMAECDGEEIIDHRLDGHLLGEA